MITDKKEFEEYQIKEMTKIYNLMEETKEYLLVNKDRFSKFINSLDELIESIPDEKRTNGLNDAQYDLISHLTNGFVVNVYEKLVNFYSVVSSGESVSKTYEERRSIMIHYIDLDQIITLYTFEEPMYINMDQVIDSITEANQLFKSILDKGAI